MTRITRALPSGWIMAVQEVDGELAELRLWAPDPKAIGPDDAEQAKKEAFSKIKELGLAQTGTE